LYDCKNVAEVTTKNNYIKATCIKNNGLSYTGELDLDLCFGNGHGQLKTGTNFSHSCYENYTRILTDIVIVQKPSENAFDKDKQTYPITKDGNYYLNAK